MPSRALGFLGWLVLLTALYLVMLGSLQLWDLIAGLLLSLTVLVWWRRDASDDHQATSTLFALPRFLFAVARSVIAGCWQVLLVSSHLRPIGKPGMLELPIGARSRQGVAVFTLVVTLSPGSVVIDVDWERQVILLHLLDISDPKHERRRLEAFYQRYQRPLFP